MRKKHQKKLKITQNTQNLLKKSRKIYKIQDILRLHDNSIIRKQNEYSFNYFRTKIQFSWALSLFSQAIISQKHLIGCWFKRTVWAPFLKVFAQTFHTSFVFEPFVLFWVIYLQKLKTGNMSGIPRTDVELLRCALPVDIAMFPEAKDNLIAQDFGE